MKVCTKCGLEKDESEYALHSKVSGRLKAACKLCTTASARRWASVNPDKIKVYNTKYSKEHRAKLNADAVDYRKRNAEKIKEARASKYAENSDEIKALVYEYRKQNPHQVTKWNASRRARVRDLTPELTDEQEARVEYLYWLAKDLRAVTGETYHVDHIQPLAKGGLHHPNNLQVLPADINLKKGAK